MPFQVTEENASALMPLFKPWEEPIQHRLPNPESGEPAIIRPGRRPSKVAIVRAIRAEVDAWRRGGYAGVSLTSRILLDYWFNTEHLVESEEGKSTYFRYHWAQREAMETLIYLYELRRLRTEAELLFECGEKALQDIALGINPQEDRWLKTCCKVATGGGKTKVMSLAIVWSYFHSLREPDSDLAQHFVLIAPNLTVYERLKDDFANCAIFYRDPLIPDEWKDQFQVQVILQDEPGGAATQGTVYLTNIHRLYETRSNHTEQTNSESLLGPAVARARALNTGENLRARIATHPRILLMNDEAHHLHDPELAWVKAISTLDLQSRSKGNQGVCLQVDFTATPKHNDGSLFRHIICDFPLGEAVDAGIVKVPVLGESDQLTVTGSKKTPATEKYRMHLQLGYQRYAIAYEQLSKIRKPILFVMTEDTESANEVTNYLDTDQFPLLKGRVLNVHTKLKGRIKTVQRFGKEIKEFEESETGMKDDDLRALREMSRELDSRDSKFRCVVSVMMLREGWDVRNVTTIIPLRPYKADSGILPEQTLGRGLRRMFPLGDVPEMVTVIEHPAFRKLYQDELAQEGLDIPFLPVRETIKNSVSIFVDKDNKDTTELDIQIPLVSDSITLTTELSGLSFEEVEKYFNEHFNNLPIGKKKIGQIDYKERQMFTDEIVAVMKFDLGLLEKSWSAAAYFAKEIGRACHLTSPHQALTPLIERFISEVLFEHKVDLYSGEVDHRMRDADVAEYIRATFTPLILGKVVQKTNRQSISAGARLSDWLAFQATSTEAKPAVPGQRTMFNLVPCDSDFEHQFVDFCDAASDVIAFAKNAGPQKLMIDYQKSAGTRALYIPDFFVRAANKTNYLVEMKGRVDKEVPIKARAAMEWCKTASNKELKWEYVYVPYSVYSASAAGSIEELARVCKPSLVGLIEEAKSQQLTLPLEEAKAQKLAEDVFTQFMKEADITELSPAYESLLRQSISLLDHAIRTKMPDFAHAFQPLLGPLDMLAIVILEKKLKGKIPTNPAMQEAYFKPYLSGFSTGYIRLLERNGQYLKENLIFGRSINKLGTLLFCLDYANNNAGSAPGVWVDVEEQFSGDRCKVLYGLLKKVNDLRNTRVAHVEAPLNDEKEAHAAMLEWLKCIDSMSKF